MNETKNKKFFQTRKELFTSRVLNKVRKDLKKTVEV